MKPGPTPNTSRLKLLNDTRPSRQRRPLKTRPTLEATEPDWATMLPGDEDLEVRAVAASTWAAMIATLDPVGAVSPHDLPTLADFCVISGRIVQCEKRLSVEGLTLTGRDGGMVRHPLWSSLNQLRGQARALGDRLGVGVGARERLNLRPVVDDEDNPFDSFVARGILD